MVSKVVLTSPASLCTACRPRTLSIGLFFMMICRHGGRGQPHGLDDARRHTASMTSARPLLRAAWLIVSERRARGGGRGVGTRLFCQKMHKDGGRNTCSGHERRARRERGGGKGAGKRTSRMPMRKPVQCLPCVNMSKDHWQQRNPGGVRQRRVEAQGSSACSRRLPLP